MNHEFHFEGQLAWFSMQRFSAVSEDTGQEAQFYAARWTCIDDDRNDDDGPRPASPPARGLHFSTA